MSFQFYFVANFIRDKNPLYSIKYILQGFCRFTFYINVNSYVSTFPLYDLFTNCIQMQYTSIMVLVPMAI